MAIVTGAARGIGRAIALTLAAEGAALALCDVNHSGLLQTLAAIPATSAPHQAYEVDVAYSDQVRQFVQAVVDHVGHIDILVNNAGIVERESWLSIGEEQWDRIHAVNVKGPFLLTQAVARHLIDSTSGGAIVNTSSISGRMPQAGKMHYFSSKAALIHLTRRSAMELGTHGIRVNAICPGVTDTQLVPHPITNEYIRAHRIVMGRAADPQE